MKPTKAAKPKAPKKMQGVKGDGDLDRAGVIDPWQAALRALVQDDTGSPLANLLRELLPKAGLEDVPVPFGVVSALAELLDPTTARNLYRFLDPPPALSNENLIRELERERKRWLESEEVREARRAKEAANIERARLVNEAKESCETPEDDRAWFEDFAKSRRDRKALQTFDLEARALAALEEKRRASFAAVRLSIKPLTKNQCERLERRLEIMGDMWLADGRRPFTAAKAEAAEKHGLSERQIDNILKEAPPGPWQRQP